MWPSQCRMDGALHTQLSLLPFCLSWHNSLMSKRQKLTEIAVVPHAEQAWHFYVIFTNCTLSPPSFLQLNSSCKTLAERSQTIRRLRVATTTTLNGVCNKTHNNYRQGSVSYTWPHVKDFTVNFWNNAMGITHGSRTHDQLFMTTWWLNSLWGKLIRLCPITLPKPNAVLRSTGKDIALTFPAWSKAQFAIFHPYISLLEL